MSLCPWRCLYGWTGKRHQLIARSLNLEVAIACIVSPAIVTEVGDDFVTAACADVLYELTNDRAEIAPIKVRLDGSGNEPGN